MNNNIEDMIPNLPLIKIEISGPMRSGKTTIAKIIKKAIAESDILRPYQKKARIIEDHNIESVDRR